MDAAKAPKVQEHKAPERKAPTPTTTGNKGAETPGKGKEVTKGKDTAPGKGIDEVDKPEVSDEAKGPGKGKDKDKPGKGKEKDKNGEVQDLQKEVEDLKKKLGEMGNKPGEGAGQGQGQQGGGGGGDQGGGGAPPAGGGGAPQAGGAQAPGQGQGQQGDINSQLQGLAAQCLMQGGGLGGQQFGAQPFGGQPGGGVPGVGGVGAPGAGGANPFQAGFQQGLGGLGGGQPQPFGGAGGGSPQKQQLAAAYQQAVSNPQSAQQIRPETHALVQAALGGGGAQGLGQQFGQNPLAAGLGAGQNVPGLGGVQQNFGQMAI